MWFFPNGKRVNALYRIQRRYLYIEHRSLKEKYNILFYNMQCLETIIL